MVVRRMNADVAQLVEQLIRNEQVVGSSPIISSIWDIGLPSGRLFSFDAGEESSYNIR